MIIFRSQDNKDIVTFSDFKFELDDVLKRIIFRIEIHFEMFNADTQVEGELYDFFNLKEGLIGIYNDRFKTYIFNPIGEQLYVKFDLLEAGGIDIAVQLKNVTYTGTLSVLFKSDLTFLPELWKSIDYVLNNA